MTIKDTLARHRSVVGLVVAAGVVVLAAGVYWFGPQHLLVNRTADEAIPAVTSPSASGSATGSTGSTPEPSPSSPEADPTEVPEPDVEVLAAGSFLSLAHESTGEASIVRTDDGRVFLRLEDLDVLSGPDLKVYLSSAPADGPDDAFGTELVADLGGLRANKGNLTYEIPSGVDLDVVASVAIWCKRFAVGFGVAPLDPV